MSRPLDCDTLDHIVSALAQLRYGEVVIAVHDGEIVQISRTEKLRVNKPELRRSESR